jgi:hypothetical protein
MGSFLTKAVEDEASYSWSQGSFWWLWEGRWWIYTYNEVCPCCNGHLDVHDYSYSLSFVNVHCFFDTDYIFLGGKQANV